MTENFSKDFKDEISILISDKENVIWGIIHDIIYHKKAENTYTVNYVKKLISAYIRVSEMIGETLPYCSVEDFFCYFNHEGKNEYDKFLQFSQNYEGEELIENDLEFILNHTEGEICRDISAVLNDNGNDPHSSAVYTTNMIKCFILVSNQIGANYLYKDVCGFFIAHGYSQKQFYDFERKRKEEAVYYRSVQY